MKEIILSVMLLAGITGTTVAQEVSPAEGDKTFEVPEGFLTRRFAIDLGKGNTMQLELSDYDDISRFENFDSLLKVFFKDLDPFKDSLTDELSAKRIDYVTDVAGRKKIRIKLYKQDGAAFVIRQGEVAALKTEQDTVNIIGIINGGPKYSLLKSSADQRYYRLRFYVNDLNDLKNYSGNNIGEKITAIAGVRNSKWSKDKNGNWHIVKGDKDISAKNPGGMIAGTGDYLATHLSANIGNYKNYFVPSLSLGLHLVFNNGSSKKIIGLAWEPNFVFAKDAAGRLQTFRNDFYTLSVTQSGVRSGMSPQYFNFTPNISLGYLKKSRGEVFDKNTFRVGIGQFGLFEDRIKLEPCLYFNNLFKNTTPGLKLSVVF